MTEEEKKVARQKSFQKYRETHKQEIKERRVARYWANVEEERKKAAERSRKWRRAHPGEDRKYWEKWNAADPIRYFLSKVKSRANRRGIKFDLKREDIQFPEFCPIFKSIRLDYNGEYGAPNYPNLDRIIPSKGYVSGNVRIISHKANIMKQDGSAEEHEAIAKYIRENIGTEFVQ